MNRLRPLMFAVFAAIAAVGCCDTASAQPQLTVTPPYTTATNPLVFNNVPSGSVSQTATITVGLTGSTLATVIITVNPASPWLVVTPGGSVNIPATLSIQCNTANLTTGNYTGSFTVTVDGNPQDQVTVFVNLNVTGVSQLYANPPSVVFSAQVGASAATPNGIPVQILSSGVQLNYNLQAQTGNGGNWLLLSAQNGSTGGSPFTVSVNPSALTAVSYPAIFNGTITAISTTTNDAVIVPVQVTLNATAALSVTPTNPPPFLYQAGTGADPAQQTLNVTAANGGLVFSVQESPAVTWLVLSPLGGTAGNTATPITMTAKPAELGLQPGTYTTNVVVTPSGEAALAPIPVSLVVASHPLIQLSTNTLSFTAAFAGTLPPAQSVTINGAAVPFTVSSSASWLIAGPATGTTPATITVQVNTAGLTPQSYAGTVTIAPTNGDPYTETIAVTLIVSAASQLIAGPESLLFSYETGQSPAQSQVIEVQTTSQPLSFTPTITTANCGANWLSATPSSLNVQPSSNTTLTVSVVTTGLTPGICSGTITLSYFNGLNNSTLPIQVTLAVSSGAELRVNMMPGFGIPAPVSQTSAPFQEQISLTSTDPVLAANFIATLTNVGGGGAWLSIAGSTSGTTPQNLFIQFNPAAVTTPGSYTGTVTISSSSLGSTVLSIPVTLTVASNTSVMVTPGSLTFTEASGGSAPAAQTLTLSSNPGVATYTAVVASTTGGNWLQVSPTSGNTNGPVQVSVLANTLSAGSYPAQISFAFQGAVTTSATVNVVLNVTTPTTVAASPTSLSYSYQIGGTAPAVQQLTVSSTGGSAQITVSANSSGWLSAGTTTGATPQTINISVNPQGLTAQTYSGSISIASPGVLATPLSIPVTLTVTPPPAPAPVVIENNATGAAGAISVGEEIAIKGSFLGPASPAGGVLFSLNSAGAVPNILSGVQVLFDNNPGTPIFVSASQINVMVPYEINGRLSTTMVVMYNGIPSNPFQLSVVPAAPGLFTNNFSGTGQVAATNQNGSINGAAAPGFAPAPRGTYIGLYGTGGGQTSPISATGSVTSGLLNFPNVTATIGGLPATVQFGGAAPFEVTGVFQINVLIPLGVTPGNAVPVTVAIGNASTPLGTTIAVQ